MVQGIAAGRVIYVDDYGPPSGNGSSWSTAFRYLQDALTTAQPDDEIRVAQGKYWPDKSNAEPNGTDDRYATFQLKNGVTIKGSYAGAGKPDPNFRNFDLYKTILSGDLASNDIGDLDDPSRNDNSFHILTGSNTNSTAVLDGFRITAGNATMHEEMPYGGGMIAMYGGPTLANCTFTGHSGYAGAGVCFLGESSPNLTNCTFTGNSAEIGGALVGSGCDFTLTNCTFTGNSAEIGGALFGAGELAAWCHLTLTNCTFTGNSGDWGGAFYSETSTSTLTNCVFSENTCSTAGGAIHQPLSSSWLYNCLFTGNSCDLYGGAMFYWYDSIPHLFNCTFAGNSAPNGNAIACDTLPGYDPPPPPSTVYATNCIFWNGGNEIWNNNDSIITVAYSDVQDGWFGTGNIDADPCFADAGNGDCHLKSEAGRWNPDSQSWIEDVVTSPCIDAGDLTSDWTSELWPHGEHINMGAYGGTAQASMSLSEAGNVADLNIDGCVGHGDTKLLTEKWLYEVLFLPEDLNRDGIVNFVDFSILSGIWGFPGMAGNPNPEDGDLTVKLDADLSWTAGCNAESHDVYFGTSNPPAFIGNQTATTYDTGTMTYSTMYYWRINEVNPSGTTTGTIWIFKTTSPGPP